MPTVMRLFENRLLHDARRIQHEHLNSPEVERTMLTRRRSEILQASNVLHELFLRQRHPLAQLPRARDTQEGGSGTTHLVFGWVEGDDFTHPSAPIP